MTVQLNWPPDIVAQLQQEAAQNGRGLDDYLLQRVLSSQSDGLPLSPSSEGRESVTKQQDANRSQLCREAATRIWELRTTNVLGPDLTIRDLIEEGRRF